MDEQQTDDASWQPLDETQRRVLGVLIEKAKTTPDNYPISLASLTAGCNQKSNRAPQMQLDEEEVDLALDQLRGMGLVSEVQGGRVSKFRHLAYDWLGVKGHQIAVVTELLLRGPQTVGELRSRASRMETFDSMEALLPVLEQLKERGLIFDLTPPGRGQLVAHCLYEPDELARIKEQASGGAAKQSASPASINRSATTPAEVEALRAEIAELRQEIAGLKTRIEVLES